MRKTASCLLLLLWHVFVMAAQPKLSSWPSAEATIFLDFDGHFVEGTLWNGAGAFYCAPSGLRENQIIEIFHRVAEDYRPFHINITTDSAVFVAAPLAKRLRVVITPTSDWYPGVGGVAFTGSFTWGDDTPAFVFSDRMGFRSKNVAECCSHESGHTLGLSHQAKYENCKLISTYNEGKGTGEIGWAPIMGNSYGRNFSGWNNGPTPYGCMQEQDNLSIITAKNGFTYRNDDHSDLPAHKPTKLAVKNDLIVSQGLISTNTDKDAFEFETVSKGNLKLDILPFAVGEKNAGSNLDVKAILLDERYSELAVFDPQEILNISIDTTLEAGKYFIIVSGAANENTSEYGSLGSYSINGLFVPVVPLPVYEANLKGEVKNRKHVLSWDIVTNSEIKEIKIESAEDGIVFKEEATVSPASKVLNVAGDHYSYYRMQITGSNGVRIYSNIVALEQVKSDKESFNIKALTKRFLVLSAGEKFRYQISDTNGRILEKGSRKPGLNHINFDNLPQGVYYIKLFDSQQTAVKQILRM